MYASQVDLSSFRMYGGVLFIILEYKNFFLRERWIFVSSTSVVEEIWLAQNYSQCLIGSKQISPNKQLWLTRYYFMDYAVF